MRATSLLLAASVGWASATSVAAAVIDDADNDIDFDVGTRHHRRSLGLMVGKAIAKAASPSSSHSYREKAKSGKEHETLSKAGKDGKVASDKSHEPFTKSGERPSVNGGVGAPHKVFAKSAKMGYDDKAGKGYAGKSSGKSKAVFAKAGKSKGSKGDMSMHHQHNGNDNLFASANDPPTPRPTCSSGSNANEEGFDVCIAIDDSGSVCSILGPTGGVSCTNCSPGSFCKSPDVDTNTCCTNFANIKDFSSSVVTSLGELPVDKYFSVVRFSNTATVEGELAPSDKTMEALSNVNYSGGGTNHAAAIRECKNTLSATVRGKRKFMLLITDGIASVPFNPEGAALAAATAAKDDGVSIIPVFISSSNDDSALSFMGKLSSSGEVYNVADFESLDVIRDSLVKEVSTYC